MIERTIGRDQPGLIANPYRQVDDSQRVDEQRDDLQRILDDDAERTARRVVRRHKFGRLSDRRIITLLRPHADALGVSVQDRQLVELWFDAFARHVERLRRPNASA